jgi:hypothetical protein
MDPLSALSVAGVAISLVDTSLTFLKDASKIYRSATGQNDCVARLRELSSNLSETTKQLESQLTKLPMEGCSPSETLLRSILSDSKRLNTDIDFVIKDLTITVEGMSWMRRAAKTAKATMKGVLSREKIDDLSKQLSTMSSQLMLAMLLRLQYACQ